MQKAIIERDSPRFEQLLYVLSLQTARSALISCGPVFLVILSVVIARIVLGSPTFFRYRIWAIIAAVFLMIHAVLEWYRRQARITLNEKRLYVTVPLLGNIAFELDGFRRAAVIAPELPLWTFEVVALSAASLLLSLEGYRFLSGVNTDPINILLAVEFLVVALQTHGQRDSKELELRFGEHTDWRRHVWSRRKVTFRGREEVLRELKREVEAVAG